MRLAEFDHAIEELDYPTTVETITRKYESQEIHFQDGTERLDRVFERSGTDSFATADEVRMTLYGALPGEAIGRKGYSDRDPPGVEEVDHLSF